MQHQHSRRIGVLVLLAAAPLTAGTVTMAAHAAAAAPRVSGGARTSSRDLGDVGTLLPTLFPSPEPTTDPAPTADPSPTAVQPVETIPPTPGSTPTPTPPPGAAVFRAADGHDYPAGQQIVKSRDKRELFWGEDFDTGCYDGAYFDRGLARFERLAQMIEASGRRAVLAVAPNKTAIDTEELKGVVVPHRTCARRGLYTQRSLLRSHRSATYLPLMSALEASDDETYWRTDTHWNPLGAAIYAKRLGMRLDKPVGRAYAYRHVAAKRYGDLSRPYGKGPREEGNGAKPTMKVKVHPAPGQVAYSHTRATTADYRWTTTPARRAIPGSTLLVGDSFTYLGLPQLRPLLADGHFLWTGLVPAPQIISGIVESDTVVIEVVQRFVARSILAGDDFQDNLAAALAANPRTR